MSAGGRVALVTGGNRGIGLEIVRQLCKKFEGRVILAARNSDNGMEAAKQLYSEGLVPTMLQLDVENVDSITRAKEEVARCYGRVDVLVNNAAVLHREDPGLSFHDNVRHTMDVNYHGLLNVTSAFLPLLQPNSRIINMSSGLGNTAYVKVNIKEQVLRPDLTVERLTGIMENFVRDAQDLGSFGSKGWPEMDDYTAYKVSKMGVCRFTELLACSVTKDHSKRGTLVNSDFAEGLHDTASYKVCPGWVRTRMGTMAATKSVEEGADTAVYLALLPAGTTEPHGQFLRDRAPKKWK